MNNVEVVLGTFRAVEERDVAALFALFHDEIEFSDAPSLPYGGTLRGKQTLWSQLTETPEKSWLGTWEPLQPTEAERRMDPRVVAAAGDEVSVLYIQRGLSPAGEPYEGSVMGLYEVREERFARAQMFHFDAAALVAYLGRASAT